MSVEETAASEPAQEQPRRTRICRVCSVELNAASARCPYCGTRQFRYQPILGWRGTLICLVAVAAAVLITRAVIYSEQAHDSYVYYDGDNIGALLPTGWQNQLPSAQHGTAIVGYAKAGDPADSVQIQAVLDAGGTPHTRLLALHARLGTQPGVARGYLGLVHFPGGVADWSLDYTLDRVDYAVFMFDACSGAIGVTVTLSASSEGELGTLSTALPENAEPVCDGPAFSDRDRADPSLPLAPR